MTRTPASALARLPAGSVLGHRGNRAHSPENTLYSMREAVHLGVHGLEFDVRLTRDGEVVVMHDPTVDRTTGGSGVVADMTWDETRRLDAGARFTVDAGVTFPFRGHGIGVPRLADVIDAFPGLPLLIEIKVTEASDAVKRVLLEREAVQCTVAGFAYEILAPFEGTGIPHSASTREVARMYLPALLGRRYRTLPFQVISVPPVYNGLPLPLGALARSASLAGVPVLVWTVNDPVQARRLWARGIRGVISDDPGAML